MPPDVELVLLKQLASCLATPMLVAGRDGDLIFYNESAELLVGQRFEESGELSVEEWGSLLQTSNEVILPRVPIQSRVVLVVLPHRERQENPNGVDPRQLQPEQLLIHIGPPPARAGVVEPPHGRARRHAEVVQCAVQRRVGRQVVDAPDVPVVRPYRLCIAALSAGVDADGQEDESADQDHRDSSSHVRLPHHVRSSDQNGSIATDLQEKRERHRPR